MQKKLKYVWASGFIDADGTITIKRCKRENGKWNYSPYIAVSQSDCVRGALAINILKELFTGNIYYWTSTQNMKLLDGSVTKYKRNNTICWQVTSKQASECLIKILPYLVAKKRQGELLSKFIDECYRGEKFRAHRLTDNDRKIREKYFNSMRQFNVKGFSPSTTERENT